jgi:hypothetical protein
MIFAILSCVSIVFLGASWIFYRRNIELFLCFLIAINFDFFSILPKFVGYQYLLLPIIFVLLFESLLTGKLALGRYGWWIIAFLGITVMGIYVAKTYGQGISLGIKAAKFMPLILVYFLLACRKVAVEKFATYFIAMALVVAALATISTMTNGTINFFPGIPKDMLHEQMGRLRITAGQYVISAAAVMAFARYANDSRIRYLFASAVLFAEVIFIQQTRGFIVAIFLSMCVVYVLSHKLTPLRLSIYLILTGCCLCSWLVLSSMDLSGIGFVKRSQGDLVKRGGKFGGSLQARMNGYNFYWDQMQKYMITGRGLQNFNWEGNKERELQKYMGIHLSDIGVIHFLVQAGLVGFFWLLYGLCKLWTDMFKMRNHLVVASYFIIGTFTLPTLDMFLRENDSLFLFAVFLGLASSIIFTTKTESILQET